MCFWRPPTVRQFQDGWPRMRAQQKLKILDVAWQCPDYSLLFPCSISYFVIKRRSSNHSWRPSSKAARKIDFLQPEWSFLKMEKSYWHEFFIHQRGRFASSTCAGDARAHCFGRGGFLGMTPYLCWNSCKQQKKRKWGYISSTSYLR